MATQNSVDTEEAERAKREVFLKAKAVCGPELYEVAKVEQYDWYVGMLGRNDVEPYLKKQGEYAVRAHDHRTFCELVLSVRAVTMVNHITLICDKGTKRWTLTTPRGPDNKFFATIPELIEHYRKDFLPIAPPNDRVILTQACKRPKWILKRQNVEIENHNSLGSGNFCDVYKGKLNKRRVVAVKVCHVSSVDGKKSEEQIDGEHFAREALVREGQVMQSIRHWNVISFFGICFDKPPVMIVMELCPGGSLVNHLQRFGDRILAGERIKYAQESAEGMAHLHLNECIHRDLAARNCLISKYGVVKIADFGLSKLISEVNGNFGTKQQIPVRWMAPESLQRAPSFTDKSDVWAYGVLLYEIFSNGERPWNDWENKKVATYIRRAQMPDFPARTPSQIVELVKEKIWLLDPTKREGFKYIVARLNQISTVFPCPKIEDLTLNEIPGVQALMPEEIQVLQEVTEDVAMEVVTSNINDVKDLTKPPTAAEMAIARERDVTVDESSTPVSPAAFPHKREKNSGKKRSIPRRGQRIPADPSKVPTDTSRDASQEHIVTFEEDRQLKKPPVKKVIPLRKPSVQSFTPATNLQSIASQPTQQAQKQKSTTPGQKQ